jgi:DNA-binding MarR family transcriptional regulator/N-acetylglutamate synthase-like GNAT family acetyltransferase
MDMGRVRDRMDGPGDEVVLRAEAMRHFNRFYTQKIGVLRGSLHGSPFSLAEARVLYELAHRDSPTAAALATALDLDQGYLSRILRQFERTGLLTRKRSKTDGRASHLTLTKAGRAALEPLDAGARAEAAAMLARHPAADQVRVLDAMRTIEEVLGDRRARVEAFVLREHRPGDLGWIVHRHGALYAAEHGWDERFEALVAGIVAEFATSHDPARERCLIAEQGGENVGSVLVVAKSKSVAQLRLLLLEPRARGHGIGRRLVEECIRFARQAGYSKLVLWTDAGLHAARHVYEQAGFRLTGEKKHTSFGHDLTSQTWELRL